jgi:hypothetical protein
MSPLQGLTSEKGITFRCPKLEHDYAYLPEKVSGLGASVDVALMKRLLRIVGVKLSRLLAQSPVELELYHETHEVPAIVCGYVRLVHGPTD